MFDDQWKSVQKVTPIFLNSLTIWLGGLIVYYCLSAVSKYTSSTVISRKIQANCIFICPTWALIILSALVSLLGSSWVQII